MFQVTIPNDVKRLCLYACCYDGSIMPGPEQAMVAQLQEIFQFVIIIVSDRTETQTAQDEPSSKVTPPGGKCTIHKVPNKGLDFGKWKYGFDAIGYAITRLDQLCLCNDSCIASGSIRVLIEQAEVRKFGDYWGCTDTYEISPHLQSYFLMFDSKRAINACATFFNLIDVSELHNSDKDTIIRNYEIGISQYMITNGFKLDAAFPCELLQRMFCSSKDPNMNTSYRMSNELKMVGCPLIKKKTKETDIQLTRERSPATKNSSSDTIDLSQQYTKIHQSYIIKIKNNFRTAVGAPSSLRTCIHCHIGKKNIFVHDLIPVIWRVLHAFPKTVLYVTSFLGDEEDCGLDKLRSFTSSKQLLIQYIRCDNKGMDIGGKMMFFRAIKNRLDSFDWIAFLHTKSDLMWRTELITGIATNEAFELLKNSSTSKVGIIGCGGRKYPLGHANSDFVTKKCAEIFGVDVSPYYPVIDWSLRSKVSFDQEFYINYHHDVRLIARDLEKLATPTQIAAWHWKMFGNREQNRVPHRSMVLRKKSQEGFFIAGSIFWASTDYLSKFLQHIDLEKEHDMLEPGYVNNKESTNTHSWEYMFGLMCDVFGLEVVGTKDIRDQSV